MLAMERLRAYPVHEIRRALESRQERRTPSPIDLGLRLRTEALGLSRLMTPTNSDAGSGVGAAA